MRDFKNKEKIAMESVFKSAREYANGRAVDLDGLNGSIDTIEHDIDKLQNRLVNLCDVRKKMEKEISEINSNLKTVEKAAVQMNLFEMKKASKTKKESGEIKSSASAQPQPA